MNYKITALLVCITAASQTRAMQKVQTATAQSSFSSFGKTINKNPEYLVYAALACYAIPRLCSTYFAFQRKKHPHKNITTNNVFNSRQGAIVNKTEAKLEKPFFLLDLMGNGLSLAGILLLTKNIFYPATAK